MSKIKLFLSKAKFWRKNPQNPQPGGSRTELAPDAQSTAQPPSAPQLAEPSPTSPAHPQQGTGDSTGKAFARGLAFAAGKRTFESGWAWFKEALGYGG